MLPSNTKMRYFTCVESTSESIASSLKTNLRYLATITNYVITLFLLLYIYIIFIYIHLYLYTYLLYVYYIICTFIYIYTHKYLYLYNLHYIYIINIHYFFYYSFIITLYIIPEEKMMMTLFLAVCSFITIGYFYGC